MKWMDGQGLHAIELFTISQRMSEREKKRTRKKDEERGEISRKASQWMEAPGETSTTLVNFYEGSQGTEKSD